MNFKLAFLFTLSLVSCVPLPQELKMARDLLGASTNSLKEELKNSFVAVKDALSTTSARTEDASVPESKKLSRKVSNLVSAAKVKVSAANQKTRESAVKAREKIAQLKASAVKYTEDQVTYVRSIPTLVSKLMSYGKSFVINRVKATPAYLSNAVIDAKISVKAMPSKFRKAVLKAKDKTLAYPGKTKANLERSWKASVDAKNRFVDGVGVIQKGVIDGVKVIAGTGKSKRKPGPILNDALIESE